MTREYIYEVEHIHCGKRLIRETVAADIYKAWEWIFRSYIIKPQLIEVRLSPIYGSGE